MAPYPVTDGNVCLHAQTTLNHWGRPVEGGSALEKHDNDWTRTQMMATNNVSCPVWMDWFHGGLQYQIEHHLYPDLPRHQLRAAASYVRPMCEKLGIRYHAPEFFQASGCLLLWRPVKCIHAITV